jgi:hypothetical protein
MAIGFKRQRRGNVRDCRITRVCRKPVLPEVNRSTNRDAAIGQDDLTRVPIGVFLRSNRLADKSYVAVFFQGAREILRRPKQSASRIFEDSFSFD